MTFEAGGASALGWLREPDLPNLKLRCSWGLRGCWRLGKEENDTEMNGFLLGQLYAAAQGHTSKSRMHFPSVEHD